MERKNIKGVLGVIEGKEMTSPARILMALRISITEVLKDQLNGFLSGTGKARGDRVENEFG